jgi:hypothetical protein
MALVMKLPSASNNAEAFADKPAAFIAGTVTVCNNKVSDARELLVTDGYTSDPK